MEYDEINKRFKKKGYSQTDCCGNEFFTEKKFWNDKVGSEIKEKNTLYNLPECYYEV